MATTENGSATGKGAMSWLERYEVSDEDIKMLEAMGGIESEATGTWALGLEMISTPPAAAQPEPANLAEAPEPPIKSSNNATTPAEAPKPEAPQPPAKSKKEGN